jgi:hypothetical protein
MSGVAPSCPPSSPSLERSSRRSAIVAANADQFPTGANNLNSSNDATVSNELDFRLPLRFASPRYPNWHGLGRYSNPVGRNNQATRSTLSFVHKVIRIMLGRILVVMVLIQSLIPQITERVIAWIAMAAWNLPFFVIPPLMTAFGTRSPPAANYESCRLSAASGDSRARLNSLSVLICRTYHSSG